MTWYPQDYVARIPMTDMNMRANPSRGYPGRTYRFYKGPVVFPFGFGLTYTTFAHSLAEAPVQVSVPLTTTKNTTSLAATAVRLGHIDCSIPSLNIHVDVRNTGRVDGKQTLLVFSAPPAGDWSMNKQLVRFEKVHVPAGSQRRVRVDVHVCEHMSVVDQFGIRRIPMGEHEIHIGEDLKHSITIQANLEGSRV